MKINNVLNYPHLLTPSEYLVAWLFSAYHYSVTVDEMIEFFSRYGISIERKHLENVLISFINRNYLIYSDVTGSYSTLNQEMTVSGLE